MGTQVPAAGGCRDSLASSTLGATHGDSGWHGGATAVRSDPSLLSSPASGSSVGGYDDTSSDHSPANAADPPATSANSPATPSPAPAAAGTHASTGNSFLNGCSGGPYRYQRASLPEMFLAKEAAHILGPNLGAAVLRDELTALLFLILEIATGNKSREQC